MNILPYALPIIFSFLQSKGLFGRTQEDINRENQERLFRALGEAGQTIRSYMPDPGMLQGLNRVVLQALLNNMSRYANWGFPAGMQIDTSFLERFIPRNLPEGVKIKW